MAPLTAEDRSLIKCLRLEKGWNALRMMQEFPLRKWKKSTLNDLIRKIDKTGSADRASVSGRPRSTRVRYVLYATAIMKSFFTCLCFLHFSRHAFGH